MDAAYTKKTAVVVLDDSEVRLIMKALDELRYSEEATTMTGSMLIDLAGLSQEWSYMTADQNSPTPERVTTEKGIDRVMDRFVHELYGPGESWEVGR